MQPEASLTRPIHLAAASQVPGRLVLPHLAYNLSEAAHIHAAMIYRYDLVYSLPYIVHSLKNSIQSQSSTSNQHTHRALDHLNELRVFVETPHLRYINVRFLWKRGGVGIPSIMSTYFCPVLQVENNPASLTPSEKVVPACWTRRDGPQIF